MAKIKLEDSGEKIFKLAGKTFLKGQYVVEYTETNTDSNGVLTSPEKATVFLRPIAFSQIDRQSSLPFKSPIAWTEFLDSNGDAYADFDTFSEALATAIANFNSGGATPQYKVYSALLTQTGTDTPTAIVLENTLGTEMVWSRDEIGYYQVTASIPGVILQNKSSVTTSQNFANGAQVGLMIGTDINDDAVDLTVTQINLIDSTFDLKDDELNNTFIEIRVYN